MDWNGEDDVAQALPTDLIEVILDHCDARSLAALAATASTFTGKAAERAQEIAFELGYLLPVGTTVTAGRLAQLQSHEEEAITLRDSYIEALTARRFVDSSAALRRLLGLDPLVLTRAGSVPQALLRDPAYRAYVAFVLDSNAPPGPYDPRPRAAPAARPYRLHDPHLTHGLFACARRRCTCFPAWAMIRCGSATWQTSRPSPPMRTQACAARRSSPCAR